MKKSILFLMCALLFFAFLPKIEANETTLKVKVDEVDVVFPDASPFINSDDRTMVPVRFITETMGYDVEWDGTKYEVTIQNENTKVILVIDDYNVNVNDTTILLDTIPIIKENRTYVPLRFITESFGSKIDWNNDTRTVEITSVISIPELDDFYVVEAGETLYSIGQKFNLTVDELKKLNELTDNVIKVGQKLYLKEYITYEVIAGDTLNKISRTYGLLVDVLFQYNNLESDVIKVGQQLKIPRSEITNDSSGDSAEEPTEEEEEEPTPDYQLGMVETGVDRLNVRLSPSLDSEIIGKLENGTEIKVYNQQGEWFEIKMEELEGWVHSDFVQLLTPDSELLKGKTIIIDAGHGGNDPGAIGIDGETTEGQINLTYSLLIEEELKKYGANVVMTRNDNVSCQEESDHTKELQCRVDFSELNEGDLFISVHANWYYAPYAQGTEVFYNETDDFDGKTNPYPEESKRLASLIQNKIQPIIESKDRGVKNSNFYVLRNNTIPSALVEIGFVSNEYDLKQMKDEMIQKQFSVSFTDAILEYFNVK